MPTPAIRTLVPFVACNSTDECAVIDESATCAERLCFCPSFEPLAKGTRCNTTRYVFPLALGNNCTAITDCSSTAACVEGQCRCPDGYQPSDGHNCSVIRQSDFAVTSWFAITILASSILLILMLVFYLCLVGYRSRLADRSFWRPMFGAPSSTTIVVSGQASFCGGDPTASTNMVPGMTGMTGETSGVALDSDPQTTGAAGTTMAGHHHEGHDSSHASFLELSTQGAAHSMTELRGIGGTPIESFVRPELSKERMYAKYPHLARMSVSASQLSMPASAQTRPTVSESASDEKSKKDENFPSSVAELSVKSLRRSSSRDSVKRTAASSKEGQSKGPQAACNAPCTDGWPRSDSGVSRKQVSDVSVPWSSMGSSLEALLSVPVVARVRDSSLSTGETSQEAGNELHVPFDKLRD